MSEQDRPRQNMVDIGSAYGETNPPSAPFIGGFSEPPFPDQNDGSLPEVEDQPVAKKDEPETLRRQNVEFDKKIQHPDIPNISGIRVSLPSCTTEQLKKVFGEVPNIDLTDTTPGRLWRYALATGLDLAPINEPYSSRGQAFLGSLEDPESGWSQSYDLNGSKIAPHRVKMPSPSGTSASAEQVSMMAMSYLGQGTTWSVPLLNSGFWVTFKPPGEDEIVELERLIASDTLQMGRYTYGLAYSNVTSYTIARMMNFVSKFIYRPGMTAGNDSEEGTDIFDHIRVQDIPSVLWGLACTRFPDGFGYRRSCTCNPEKCKHVVEGSLDVRNMWIGNWKALTRRQISQIFTSRNKTMTVEQLKDYQLEMTRGVGYKFEIELPNKTKVGFQLKSPTVNEFINAGNEWLGEIVANVNEVLGSDATDEERNDLVSTHSRASTLCQYLHWVEAIEFNDRVETDPDAIKKLLKSFSSVRPIRNGFMTEMLRFTERTQLSVVAIDSFTCPSCGGKNTAEGLSPDSENAIPIDCVHLFFVLVSLIAAEIRRR